MSISRDFHIGQDLSGLPLVLGLLSDWVNYNHFFLSAGLTLILFRSITRQQEINSFSSIILVLNVHTVLVRL